MPEGYPREQVSFAIGSEPRVGPILGGSVSTARIFTVCSARLPLDRSHFFAGRLALVLQDAARWLVEVLVRLAAWGGGWPGLLSDRCDAWFFLIGLPFSSAQADGSLA